MPPIYSPLKSPNFLTPSLREKNLSKDKWGQMAWEYALVVLNCLCVFIVIMNVYNNVHKITQHTFIYIVKIHTQCLNGIFHTSHIAHETFNNYHNNRECRGWKKCEKASGRNVDLCSFDDIVSFIGRYYLDLLFSLLKECRGQCVPLSLLKDWKRMWFSSQVNCVLDPTKQFS